MSIIRGSSGTAIQVDTPSESLRTSIYDTSGIVAQVHSGVNGLKSVQYGNSGTPTEVDSNGNALRVILYGPDGQVINTMAGTSFMQAWSSGLSAAGAPTSNSTLFHIRNGPLSERVMYVKKFRIDIVTIISALAGQLVDLELIRTFDANASGGASISPSACGRKDTQYADPSFSDFRYSTNMVGLTVNGITFGQQLSVFNTTSIAGSRNEIIFNFDEYNRPLVLRSGEGLAIRNITSIGSLMVWGVKGEICWDERSL